MAFREMDASSTKVRTLVKRQVIAVVTFDNKQCRLEGGETAVHQVDWGPGRLAG